MKLAYMPLFVALGFYLFPASAYAFDVDGYSSGMSVADLEKSVVGRGNTFVNRSVQGEPLGTYHAFLVDVKRVPVGVAATFVTCAAKLVHYGHNLDFDSDYANLLERLLRDYGQPKKVYVQHEPWSGPHGGDIVSTYMTWYNGQDRVDLSFVPEGRTSKGELRFTRFGSISYSTKNSCWPEKNW